MSRVKILVDSTADVPHEVARDLGIHVIPLNVHFGDETYLDWVDLSPQSFYKLLETSPHHPRTSQPSPGDFAKTYEELTADGSSVVSIHISRLLSGTMQSAELGKAMVEGARIEIIDSQLASMAFGVVAVQAARAAREGRSFEEVVALARDLCPKVRVFFAVDTLEYLARNGRIGKAQALLGGLLSIKPLLTLEDGLVAPLEKVRGDRKVIPRIVELLGEQVPPGSEIRACFVNANCPDKAGALQAEVEKAYKLTEVLTAELGPVIGTHTGPGTVGMMIY
ncbi:MAG: DegV family protein [Bacillota bacterium]